MRERINIIQELFIILTDSEYPFVRPVAVKLRSKRNALHFDWYYLTKETIIPKPKFYEMTTSFSQVKDHFGEIVSKWTKGSLFYGQGFYLYLAMRRGMEIYSEHRFINFVWGLESFHRSKFPSIPAQIDSFRRRIDDILAKLTDLKDKKWVKGKLKYAYEPTLEQRLFEIVIDLPLDLERNRVRKFARRCAELRNALSHGLQSESANPDQFATELHAKTEALALIYHLVLLMEIGVSTAILKHWVYEGFRSYREKYRLVAADLLDPAILKPVQRSQPNRA
jgi:hypothetical protein